MPVRIIHLISSFARGGRERQLAVILSNTDKNLYPSKIVFYHTRIDSYIDEYCLADFVIQVKANGKIERLRELNKILKSEQPDIVYTWGNGESVSALLLKPFHTYKLINGSLRHGIRLNRFSHYLRTVILHLSENVVANSQAGLKANNLKRGYILYNGIDQGFIKNIPDRAAKRRDITGIPEQIPLLISVANLVPFKDYFTILKALRLLKEGNHSFYYIILGDGIMRKEINKAIVDYGLSEIVRIPGHVRNVWDFLKVSDIYIHSSRGEGCSNSILEAMAAGLPVIVSNTGGNSEIVNNEVGRLFEYKNVKQLFEHIRELLINKNLISVLGKKAKDKIKQNFTIEIMMSNYLKIINETTAR